MNRAQGLLNLIRGGAAMPTLRRQERIGRVTLDWREYFRVFSEAHGGNPVIWKGRQLWQDGWQYSATDYAGPEWPAPTDKAELKLLQRAYWSERKKIVEEQLKEVRQELDRLKQAQCGRSVPLQQIVISTDAEGNRTASRDHLDLGPLVEREDWLAKDVVDCRVRLEALR